MMIAQKIHEAIAAVCPITAISIGSFENKSTWKVTYGALASTAQRQAAQTAIDSFDVAAATAVETASDLDAANARSDSAISALKTMTPAQAKAWVAANVNSLADAKTLLGTMAAVLCVLARRL